MKYKISENVWKILACPYCQSSLDKSYTNVTCNNCKTFYKYTDSGSLDLRLQQSKIYKCDIALGTSLPQELKSGLELMSMKSNPEVDFDKYDVPFHLTKEIMSYFPKAKTSNSLMLDLGCGNMIHKQICEYSGYEHVGLDYESENASILGDAHALPFKDEKFEFILSIAVLEHLRFPMVAMKEAYRVLKPNGIFIGTVAFLEPFHGNSFYHHTHLGTYNTLIEGGFNIEKISPCHKWNVLRAQAEMALFPKLPRLISRLIIVPLEMLHKIWWKVASHFSSRATEEFRSITTTGSFAFIAKK